jgi:hypothetical protein
MRSLVFRLYLWHAPLTIFPEADPPFSSTLSARRFPLTPYRLRPLPEWLPILPGTPKSGEVTPAFPDFDQLSPPAGERIMCIAHHARDYRMSGSQRDLIIKDHAT